MVVSHDVLVLDGEVEALMRRLNMPYARALAPDLLATAKAQRWEPVEVVRALLAEESRGRSAAMLATRRKQAGFPTGKSFESWDEEVSSIPAPTQQALSTLEWVSRRENLAICGPAGTGKSFFLEALGHKVIDEGGRVSWLRLEDLGGLIRAHSPDDQVMKTVERLLRADLVVVDDIGLLPVSDDAAEGLYRLVDAAYEKRSVAISSNLHPSAFDQLMPKTVDTATVDRLLHHAHLVQTSGESIRLSQAVSGAGVVALSRLRWAWWSRPILRSGWAEFVAARGQISWPLVGNSRGRLWAFPTGRRHPSRATARDLPGPGV